MVSEGERVAPAVVVDDASTGDECGEECEGEDESGADGCGAGNGKDEQEQKECGAKADAGGDAG